MRESILNRLGYAALDCVRWAGVDNEPDSYDKSLNAALSSQYISRPVAIEGMEITTFQAVYTPDESISHSDVSFSLHFQTSEDGYHWDDIPDSSFSVNISTILLSYDLRSATYEVLANAKWIRVVINASTEGGGHPNDSTRIYVTTKEN